MFEYTAGCGAHADRLMQKPQHINRGPSAIIHQQPNSSLNHQSQQHHQTCRPMQNVSSFSSNMSMSGTNRSQPYNNNNNNNKYHRNNPYQRPMPPYNRGNKR